MNAKLYLNQATAPAGFELAAAEAVQHPTTLCLGALVRNINTGVYCICSAGTISACPQQWARKMAANDGQDNKQ